MAEEPLHTAEESLEQALEQVEDDEARYHIREAAQRVVVAEWKHEH